MSKKKTSEPDRVQAALEFMSLGFDDYIAARTLLLNGQPLPGAVLAATAVEKYIKAFGAIRGNFLEGHLQAAHVRMLRNYLPELYRALNPEFFPFLQRCYELRYTDNLPEGLSAAIHSREVLAALDETVLRFEWQMKITREPSGEPIRTPYKTAIGERSPHLFSENYLLLQQSREEFLKGHNVLYTMMNRGAEERVVGLHAVVPCPTDGHFERSGIRSAKSEDFGGREPPRRTYSFAEAFGEEAMRLARITGGRRSVRSFHFGATLPGSTQGALMKCAFREGEDATYFLAPAICIHVRNSVSRALRERHFQVREDARREFLGSQPDITEADWVHCKAVVGCEVHVFVDSIILILHLHESGQERIALHPTLAPALLYYLGDIIDAGGMVDSPPDSV